jgi:4-hydroxyphenylpyruvate dioxygenase
MESKMAPHLSLTGYHSIQFYVKDLERAVRWHSVKFDFREVARSTKDSEKRHGMRSIVLRGPGQIGWIFTQPIEEASTAGKYLKSHPEGLGFLNFEVKSIAQACEFLAERKAPFLYDIQEHRVDGGLWRETAIATPLSDAGFRFIEKSNYTYIYNLTAYLQGRMGFTTHVPVCPRSHRKLPVQSPAVVCAEPGTIPGDGF